MRSRSISRDRPFKRTDPPVLSGPDDYAESGRGLVLVNALSKEWSYFFPPGGGKVVYCVLEIA
jgi:hypothetical protein